MKLRTVLVIVAVVLILGGAGVWAYETLIYTEQGGAKMVFQSGAELELQSGAIFDSQGMLAITVPTAQTTATPGFQIDNLAAGSASVFMLDSGTPVAEIDTDGGVKLGIGTPVVVTSHDTGDLVASDDVEIIDDLHVEGAVKIGLATPVGITWADDDLIVNDDFEVISDAHVQGNLYVGEPTPVGATIDGDDLIVADDAEVISDLHVQGVTYIGEPTPVGISADGDDLLVADDIEVIADLHVQGNQYIGEPTPVAITMDGDDLIIADDLEVIGTGYFAGAVEMDSTLDVQGGSITLQNDEVLGNAVDNAVTLGFAVGTTTFYGQPTVAESGDGIDLTQTLLAMDGTDVYAGLDMNLTNADQGGTSHIRGVDVNLNAADDQATESGYYAAGVWDYGIYLDDATLASGDVRLQNSLVLDAYTADNFKITDGTNTLFTVTDAGAVGNGDFSGTLTVDGISTLTGAAALNGGITVDSTAFTVADTSGNVGTTGTLDVTGLSTLSGGTTKLVNIENLMSPTVLSVPITYTAGAGGTIVLATVGASEVWFVHDVAVHVTTSASTTGGADGLLNIGTTEDVDGFCVLTETQLTTTYAPFTGFAEGWTCSAAADRGVFFDEVTVNGFMGSFVLESTETIDAVWSASGDDLLTGAATVYIVYTRVL